MKQNTIIVFTCIFLHTHPGEPLVIEEIPEFFYVAVWQKLWEKHKNNPHIPLTSKNSPLAITTFIPLFQEKRQLQLYLHRLNETSPLPCVILKVRTRALCSISDIPRTFSKDRFGHYRFNETTIPAKAIV